MRWALEQIRVSLVDETTEGKIATIRVEVGEISLILMGEIVESSDRLVVARVHVSSHGVAPNAVGVANLRQVARVVMEIGDYEEIVVQGAIRTTGAHPGHRPRSIRISRSRLPRSE